MIWQQNCNYKFELREFKNSTIGFINEDTGFIFLKIPYLHIHNVNVRNKHSISNKL